MTVMKDDIPQLSWYWWNLFLWLNLRNPRVLATFVSLFFKNNAGYTYLHLIRYKSRLKNIIENIYHWRFSLYPETSAKTCQEPYKGNI